MNEKHPHEKELINALTNTSPQAEKAFQDNLEEQLMARLQETSDQQNKEDITMRLLSEKQKRTQGSSRLPLTLAAAVIAIVITGGLLLFIQGSSPESPLQEAICDYSGEHHSYQIQSGDTLLSISNQFSISTDSLINANCFDDNSPGLSAGQVITIPIPHPSEQTNDTRSVIVTTRDIAPGEIITLEMIELDFREADTITVIVPVCCEELIIGNTVIEAINEGVIIEEHMLDNTTFSNIDTEYSPRIGIVVGHAGDERPGAVCDGLTEVSVNQAIADSTSIALADAGYSVDVFVQHDERLIDYEASLLIELHLVGCDDTSGYRVGYNNAPGNSALHTCLTQNYGNITGLTLLKVRDSITSDSFDADDIGQHTSAIMLDMGIIPIDNELLMDTPEIIVSGIVSTVDCFLRGANAIDLFSNFAPMVIARQDIPLNTIITEDMLVTVLVPNEFMHELQPPLSSFMNVISSPELAIGQQANTIIRAYEPVLMENISPPEGCSDDVIGCASLDVGETTMTLTTDDRTVMQMTPGQRVDVIVAMQYVDVDASGATIQFAPDNEGTPMYQTIVDGDNIPPDTIPQLFLERTVVGALLLNVTGQDDSIALTLVLLPQDKVVLEYLVDANIPTIFVPHVDGSENLVNEQQPALSYPLTENGFATLSIPLSQHNNGRVSASEVGNQYDVHFSLPHGYNDAPNEEITEAGDVSIVSIAGNRIVINNSTLLYFGSGNEDYPPPPDMDGSIFVSFSVNPADVWLVNRYIQNGAFFSLRLDAEATELR